MIYYSSLSLLHELSNCTKTRESPIIAIKSENKVTSFLFSANHRVELDSKIHGNILTAFKLHINLTLVVESSIRHHKHWYTCHSSYHND
jgi:hypothetical protein